VSIQVLDAGGYTQLNNQITQIEDCVAGGAQAVVLVAVSADGMDNLLRSLRDKNIVVIDATNGVSSDDVDARVLTNPHDEAYRAGEWLAKKHPKGSPEVRVVPLLRARRVNDDVEPVSVYMTPGVLQGLKSKSVAAAGVAPVVVTSRMQIDTAVRILEQGKNRSSVYLFSNLFGEFAYL